MRLLIISVLAVATIGLMVPTAYANEYSDAPDHIRELLERKDCLNESEFNTWKDGKCLTANWLPSEKMNLNNMPKGEMPEGVKEHVKKLEFEGREKKIREAYERELRTMPLTQNEYVTLSEAVQNKWNRMESDCSNRYGTPDPSQVNYGFRSMDHQFAWNECIINAQTWHEQQQNSLLYERCCISESQSRNLMNEINREKNRAYAELEADKAAYLREQAAYLREQEGLEPVSQKPQPSGGG